MPKQTEAAEMSALALRLRESYIRTRRRVTEFRQDQASNYGEHGTTGDGDGKYLGRQQRSVWERLAEAMTARGIIDPEGFMTAQFAHGCVVQPKALLSQSAWARYSEHVRGRERLLAAQWPAEREAMIVALSDARDVLPAASDRQLWQYVLRSGRYPLSAMFRYCVAVSEGMDDVVEWAHAAALREYLVSPMLYDRCWSRYIPQCLKDEAANLLQSKV